MNALVLEYAKSFLKTPYKWGGDDPIDGLDCSGLCVEILTSAGVLAHKSDYSSGSLWDYLSRNGVIGKREPGSLSFYGKSPREITHVSFHLSRSYVIEAGGGDSSTTSRARAAEQNAFIRMRLYDYRPDYIGSIYPTYPPLAD